MAGLMLLLLFLPLVLVVVVVVVVVVEAVAEPCLCFLPSRFSPTSSSLSAPLPCGIFRLWLEVAAVVDADTLLAESVLVVRDAPKVIAGLVEIKSSVAALGTSKDDGNSTEQLKDRGAVFAFIDIPTSTVDCCLE
jgi:hypothetical protein